MEGPLSKWTNLIKGWQYRWCTLDKNSGSLSYYLSKDRMIKGDRKGCVSLKRAVVGIENEGDKTFTVTSRMKSYHFQADSLAERDEWVKHLEDTIMRHACGSLNLRSMAFGELLKYQTSGEFEKKLSEADAYLQMMIDQTQIINKKMDKLSKFEDLARCSIINTYANDMLDNVKHTVILLQITKNMMNPDNASSPISKNDVDLAVEKREPKLPDDNLKSSYSNKFLSMKQYSTSEDERYFDAEENVSPRSYSLKSGIALGVYNLETFRSRVADVDEEKGVIKRGGDEDEYGSEY